MWPTVIYSNLRLVLSVLCITISVSYAYNIATNFPIIFESMKNNYFGYTVALLRNRGGEQALITAPRANSSVLGDQLKEPGVLFSCKISLYNQRQICKEVVLDKYGNTHTYKRDDKFSYKDKKDNMFLGVSLDVQQNTDNNHVVTCGHLWKNQRYAKNYLANGVCYVIDKELDPSSVQKLVPLINKSKQSLIPPGIYYYAFGQAGTSASFSEDGKYLLLGAPGFYDWAGTVLSYENPKVGNVYSNPVIPNPPVDQNLSPESYIGYSVTSGRFFDNPDNFIAIGAPRDRNSNGQVYIIRALKSRSDNFFVHLKKEGTQFGEYFGATVMAVNLNNDEFTDLLVGAPFFSTETGGDEGKVYVYISNGLGLQQFAELYGESKPNSRFGTCITGVGDINQDGFNDVAIGAPYEDRSGAVYIYHGSFLGMNTKYAQRIAAAEILPSLSGFGISISRGLDIDKNYYPDILIGSYASSQAVLLRTHPIIHLSSRLEFNPQQINTNITSCEFGREKVPCINVTMCLHYTGKHGLMNLDFEVELYMDLSRLNTVTLPRGYLNDNGEPTSVIRRNLNLEIGKDNCLTFQGYIRQDAKDVITPLEFLFKYNLAKDSRNESFCERCPIIDPNSPTNISKSITFQTGCGKDNECLANLNVKVAVVGNPKNDMLIIGQNSTLTFDIEVVNMGEPAYLSELFIYLPQETPNINQDFCTVLTDQQKQETNASLQCDLGNPLQKGQKVNIQIKVDLSKLPTNTEKLEVIFSTRTASTEVEPEDNESSVVLSFKAVADISITGIAEHEQIPFHDDKDKPTTITHTYFVMNHGPSPIRTIYIELYIPTSIQRESEILEFLTFTQLEADSGQPLTIPAKCNDSSIKLKPKEPNLKKAKDEIFGEGDLIAQKENSRSLREAPPDGNLTKDSDIKLSSRTKKSLSENASAKRKDLVIDCKTSRCILIQCMASPFINNRKFAKISVSVQLKSHVLNENLEPWYRLEFVSHGKIFIASETSSIQPERHHPDETSIKTILVRPGPPPSEEVAKWIIFVSIGIGILLLLIILITLIKIGFFKRQQKEKMRQMMMQADLKEWEPYLVPDDGCDSAVLKNT